MSIMNTKKMTFAQMANTTMNRNDAEVVALGQKSKNAMAMFYKMREDLQDANEALLIKIGELEGLKDRIHLQENSVRALIEENNKTIQKIGEIIGYGE